MRVYDVYRDEECGRINCRRTAGIILYIFYARSVVRCPHDVLVTENTVPSSFLRFGYPAVFCNVHVATVVYYRILLCPRCDDETCFVIIKYFVCKTKKTRGFVTRVLDI